MGVKFCKTAECEMQARPGREMCARCEKRAAARKPKWAMPRNHASLLDGLREAALNYAEADSDADFTRADDRLRKAALRYSGRLLSDEGAK
jgi:hypothetical protein